MTGGAGTGPVGRPRTKQRLPLPRDAEHFAAWLTQRGLTQAAAAAALGLSSHAVYQYANGLRRVHGAVAKLMLYIDKYGVMRE